MNNPMIAAIAAAMSMPSCGNPQERNRKTGRRKDHGGFGGLNRKNPFRGIACAHQPHWSKIRPGGGVGFRHIEGARDWRPSWLARDYASNDGSFADSNPIPCAFLP